MNLINLWLLLIFVDIIRVIFGQLGSRGVEAVKSSGQKSKNKSSPHHWASVFRQDNVGFHFHICSETGGRIVALSGAIMPAFHTQPKSSPPEA